jgi:uncharacterized protein (DUF2141 family)
MFRTAYFVSSLTIAGVAFFWFFSAVAIADATPSSIKSSVCVAGEGGAAMFIHVENIRSVEGNLRAQVYSSDPEEFLAKGKWLTRVDTPVVVAGKQSVCVEVPAPGMYAFVVMHDRNANGKADFFSEGFGFTNNPSLGFGPPDAEDVMINVPAGVTDSRVTLKYILGADEEKKKKRRKLKRR